MQLSNYRKTQNQKISLLSRTILLTAIFILISFFSHQVTAYSKPDGALISAKQTAHWTKAQVENFFKRNKILREAAVSAHDSLKQLEPATNGIIFYKITYAARNTENKITTATGLLALPDASEKTLNLVSYQHGTIFDNKAVPSAIETCDEAGVISAIFAGRGYAVAQADYIGQGGGAGFHPYLHARSAASSCAEFLLAVKEFCLKNNIKINDGIFLTGFSQGGHSTLALQKLLESDNEYGFKVMAAAPISGCYDLNLMLNYWFIHPHFISPFVTARLLTSYKKIYHISSTADEAFNKPYSDIVNSVFETENNAALLNTLAVKLDTLLTLEFISAYKKSQGEFYKRITENEVYKNWRPTAPIQFYHGKSDNIVTWNISETAYKLMKRNGAKVELINIGDKIGHPDAVIPSCIEAKYWFDSLKK